MFTATLPSPPRLADHWDHVYDSRPDEALSWHQEQPELSLRLIEAFCLSRHARILDAGAGTSRLAGALLDRGYRHLTLLDLSESALETVRRRLGDRAASVRFLAGDVLTIGLPEQDLWHDRAVFHFLTTAAERERYVDAVAGALPAGAHAIVATFAPGGPERCSGLPVCRYDAEALAAEFGPRFVLVRAESEVHRTPAGVEQPFTYVVLRRV